MCLKLSDRLGSFDDFTGKLGGDAKPRTFYLIENLEKFNGNKASRSFNSTRLTMVMNSKFMYLNRNSNTVDYGLRDQADQFADLGWILGSTCMKKMFEDNN